ncbi:MAG TPA: cation diffusion facilitator family transporter [Chthonomonadaceae bacterium]|nr:cation diffusion facilitator family transporter [Chthonomonadaceae bacterium]
MAGTHAHHHSHHHAADLSEGRLKLSLCLTFGFVILEALVGLSAHSLALLSDAGHNFTDALALALAWYALWIARKPATTTKTYGYHRVGILTALFNAVTLLVIAVLIFVEAYWLLFHPWPVESLPMIVVAAVAVFLNTLIALWLHGEAAHDVNVRSAFLHMVGDALSAAAVIVAGLVIHYTGWVYADPLVSVLIGLFIVYSSWGIVTETINVLLEGTPKGLDVQAMVKDMEAVPGVSDIHDLHVWTIADGMHALSCHLRVEEEDIPNAAGVVREVKDLLAERYEVRHSTIETECGGCEPGELHCRMPARHSTCSHAHAHEHSESER